MQRYDIAILGNDPAARLFVELARSRYEHVFWSEDGLGAEGGQNSNRFHLLDEQTVAVEQAGTVHRIRADVLVLAPGVSHRRPLWMPLHPRMRFGIEQPDIPASVRRVAIVGCGQSGRAMLSRLPAFVKQVAWLDARRLADAERHVLLQSAVCSEIHDRTSVIAAEVSDENVTLLLEDTRAVSADMVFVCCGTRGATASLGLEKAGLRADDAGKLWCNEDLQTWTSGIYALGGVIGYPCESLSAEEQASRILRSLAEQFETLALAN
ncbi:FAD-dependent oxidoreductase [Rubinisphaera sp. JC750]|uniref:FAD-dependent oxidoreductase n=1 Tax=Rubinisphaera sp. JC750 TaxID=2898658 RepID=UPI001F31130D|nr:FAD-dependent oxidoreductase [Rubinisphaera sp. JC750]